MYRVGFPFWKTVARMGGTVFCRVNVIHDKDAGVYVATSPDLDGLVVEAATIDQLFFETKDCIDMLLSEQVHGSKPAPVRTLWNGGECLAA